MDKIRIALVTAFALVTLMLLVEFSKFRDERNKQLVEAAQLNTPQITQPLRLANEKDVSDLPTDVPTSMPADIKVTGENTTNLITVNTDVLTVFIDLRGGDIVYIALKKFLARLDTPNLPFILMEDSQHRSYVAQSGLIGKNGTDKNNTRPLFSSTSSSYSLSDNKDSLIVDLFLKEDDVLITKRFRFSKNDYLFDVDYLIDNKGATNWEASFFAQIKRDGSTDPATETGDVKGMTPYLGFATRTIDERFKKIKFDDLEEKPFTGNFEGGWIALIQHYFLTAWIPNKKTTYEYSTIKSKSGFNLARVKSPVTIVAPGKETTIHSSFYAGPKNQYRLAKISEGLDLSVDYGVLWMIAQPLYSLLTFFNSGEMHVFGHDLKLFSGVSNWGFSIILLTIFVKLGLFPLNAKAYSSMAKMRVIQPKMLEIKDRYADDKQRQSKEMMDLYSKEGVNPLGGCLPMLIQMPVFMALYWVLLETVELRHAPFIGYIHDLSAMDPYFVMPLIMGFSMYIQQKLNPPPPDPMQAKVMQFLPIIFTFFFLFFPSGLVLYWIVNNILSISQQWYITKKLNPEIKH